MSSRQSPGLFHHADDLLRQAGDHLLLVRRDRLARFGDVGRLLAHADRVAEARRDGREPWSGDDDSMSRIAFALIVSGALTAPLPTAENRS